ncbi:uncharacterized protein LOC129572939 [Sitodiplosis mosellana]|uniref:uncharacterized protein LOC129572939 n=1 Tax=Sitodiplosis mosellana TaxID=263140 RepID=UPI002443EDF8|nr:uncharacterized protein LOC129572939 [Sitodiplosis mosellana]
MKQFLILAAVLCVVLCEDIAKKPNMRGNKKFLQLCANKSGLSKNDLKTLKEKAMYTLLTAGEQKFICCIADPLIYDGKLVMERLEKITAKKVKDVPVDLGMIKNECEKAGTKSDDLTTCPKIATFAQCIFVQIRNLVKEHKQGTSASANITGNTDAVANANTNKEIVPDTKVDVDAVPTANVDKDAVANTSANKEAIPDTIKNTDANANANADASSISNANKADASKSDASKVDASKADASKVDANAKADVPSP